MFTQLKRRTQPYSCSFLYCFFLFAVEDLVWFWLGRLSVSNSIHMFVLMGKSKDGQRSTVRYQNLICFKC